MKIPLNQFEEMFEGSPILDRGLSYYEDGHVTDVAKTSDNEFEVTVVGTDEYLVYLKIICGSAVEYTCDCPCDKGSVCKHIIASLYHLKENEFYFSNQSESPSEKEGSKLLTPQLDEILEKVSHRELKDFVAAQSKANQQFMNLFLSTFSYLGNNISKEFIKNR